MRFPFTKNSRNSGWDVNGARLFGSFHWKLSVINGIPEKVVSFSRWPRLPNEKFVFHLQISRLYHQFHGFHGHSSLPRLLRVSTKMAAGSFLQTIFQGYYEYSACLVLAPDLEDLLQHECATYKILACSKLFCRCTFPAAS